MFCFHHVFSQRFNGFTQISELLSLYHLYMSLLNYSMFTILRQELTYLSESNVMKLEQNGIPHKILTPQLFSELSYQHSKGVIIRYNRSMVNNTTVYFETNKPIDLVS
jgi:hypothetical protein